MPDDTPITSFASIESNSTEAAPRKRSLLRANSVLLRQELTKNLVNSQALARSRRRRVSGISLAVGLGCAVAGATILVLDLIEVIDVVLMCFGTFLHINAILPTDRLAIRAANWIALTVTGLCTCYACYVAIGDPAQSMIANPTPCFNSTRTHYYCISQQVLFYVDISTFGAATLLLLFASRVRRDAKGRWRAALYPRVALGRLWLVIQMLGVCGGLGRLVSGVGRFAFASSDPTSRNFFTTEGLQSELTTACTFFLLALLSQARVRRSLQARLAGTGKAAEEATAAASVSAVIGGSKLDVDSALASAALVFRGVSFEKLEPEHMQSNAPGVSLNLLAQSVQLGDIDYFLSHSWHDDGSVKWTAMKRFAESFASEHGRPPLLWFDRFSLDQRDVQGSLSHLPVHMAGCSGMCVLAGHTYCSRLWTLLELYVWLAMGKEHASIRMVVLDDGDDDGEAGASRVLRSFKDVRVHEAGCASESDREKILGIIEASFASLAAFDRHISRVLLASASHERRSSTRKNHGKNSSTADLEAQGHSLLQRIVGVRRPSAQVPQPVSV